MAEILKAAETRHVRSRQGVSDSIHLGAPKNKVGGTGASK